MDTLKRGREVRGNASPASPASRGRSSTPSRRQPNKNNNSNRNNNGNNNSNNSSNRNNDSSNANNAASPAVDVLCNYPGCKYPSTHTRENWGLCAAHLKRGFESYSRWWGQTREPSPGEEEIAVEPVMRGSLPHVVDTLHQVAVAQAEQDKTGFVTER